MSYEGSAKNNSNYMKAAICNNKGYTVQDLMDSYGPSLSFWALKIKRN